MQGRWLCRFREVDQGDKNVHVDQTIRHHGGICDGLDRHGEVGMSKESTPLGAGLTPVLEWPWATTASPFASSESIGWKGALLRCWSGTSSVMVQPPLEHHYVVMHLGGSKRVTRKHDGPAIDEIVERGSLTLVPAGTAYVWRTEGPISFAHLYVDPRHLEVVLARELDANGRGALLDGGVGLRDPILEPLLERMILEIRSAESPSKLLLDCLFESLSIRLAQKHTSQSPRRALRTVSLAPHRLRRVLEFIEANIGCDLSLADLADAAGTSQSHFSRAFHLATGSSPYRYLLRRRVDYAKVLLSTGSDSLNAVSSACGFNSKRQFGVMFKRAQGVGPKRFRMAHTSSKLRRQGECEAPLPTPLS